MLYPSDTKRPLSFFVPESEGANKGEILNSIGNFNPQVVRGKIRAREQKVVVTVKPRRIVVLTDNEINATEEFEYILVAPINTIKEYEKSKDWYSKLKDDEHPIFTYLPKGSLERYVDLSQTVSIHKSLLLYKKEKVSEERMEILEENILQCLSLGIIEEE
ncbi:type II toxin-antitoxin system PemK/MazF family toxin [Bacillus thuringiensis]|uniref:type II toxin-antitoxin system PemK/MazF family toxin n=1 Tax=Bacillus thuringiensis TaxID=1428 RepID=UPI001FAD85E8|nr:type II toxin-antitoxin system PemK/MazF family toxin [Bacillus thuringiensis]MDM8364848.1 type II toxin-antitoxin system PemK/MazF family toxin [Bacillus thuringiensis]